VSSRSISISTSSPGADVIAQRVARFGQWYQSRVALPVISSLEAAAPRTPFVPTQQPQEAVEKRKGMGRTA